MGKDLKFSKFNSAIIAFSHSFKFFLGYSSTEWFPL
jgi:hypothetical protein